MILLLYVSWLYDDQVFVDLWKTFHKRPLYALDSTLFCLVLPERLFSNFPNFCLNAPNLQCRVLPQAPQVCSPRDRDMELTEKRSVERSLWKKLKHTHTFVPKFVSLLSMFLFLIFRLTAGHWQQTVATHLLSPARSSGLSNSRLQLFPWETISKSPKLGISRDF